MMIAPLPATTASYTHAGRRRANQDAVLVREFASGAKLIAVADGMGGHAAGEVASAMALEVLSAELTAGTALAQAFAAANARVYAGAQENRDWEGMGTTLVALLRRADEYWIANIGDSRAYIISAAGIEQVTRDHSYTAEAIRAGAMTAEEAARSPWRNALTRSVGTDESVEADVFGPLALGDPHVVLLCSDGLYKAVSDTLIREFVLSIGDLDTAVEALAALAYRRGSDDNISVAAVEFGALARRPPTITLPIPIQLQSDTVGSGRARSSARGGGEPAARAESRGTGATSPAPVPRPPAARRDEPVSSRGSGRRRRERKRRAVRFISSVLSILSLLVLAGWLLA